MNPITPFRVRIKFAKLENLRFIGHLDLQRLFERALNRTGLPLRYTQGFSPKIRINIASALPLGFISSAEVLDFWLNAPVDLQEIREKLQTALPKDLQILDIQEIPNKAPSLQASVHLSEYSITLPDTYAQDKIEIKLNNLLDCDTIPVERRGKTVDIKPMIKEYALFSKDGSTVLQLQMDSSATSNGRPDELLKLLDIDPADVIIERTKLIFEE
ncbi:MAG TPA: TIGR03936 family radical SAM-associated protein [Anaerolineaceae bacterium]|nr:TIGR03936 family radical SAM-associated protein [Anaerolineaceae bacterium]